MKGELNMNIPKLEEFDNSAQIITKKINNIRLASRHIMITTDKSKVKYIKTIETIVRSSQEYKDYIAFLREYIDMTKCSFFVGINNKGSKRVSIEIHHEPFTLFYITLIVLIKWMDEGIELNALKISEEIIKLHYQNKIGLIPLSVTVHKLVHSGKIFVPLQSVRGKFIEFIEEYDQYIPEDVRDMLQIKLKMSKEIEKQDLSILEKKYTYLEVDGMVFPETLDEIVTKD